MRLKEVIVVPNQDKDYRDRLNKSFEIIKCGSKKQKLASWRNLSLFKSTNNYIVLDSEDKLIFGLITKTFMQGISIIWAENFSNGKHKNLTKEIIFELLKTGVSEIYTADKQSQEMITTHKKILSELPYRQLNVKTFNTDTKETSDNFSSIFTDRSLLFQFTWKTSEKQHTFKEDIDSSSWGVNQAYLLADLLSKEINEDFIPDLSDLKQLQEEAQAKFSQPIIDKQLLPVYENGSEWIYEYKTKK